MICAERRADLSASRKMAKLARDPHAFFRDARSPALRPFAKAFDPKPEKIVTPKATRFPHRYTIVQDIANQIRAKISKFTIDAEGAVVSLEGMGEATTLRINECAIDRFLEKDEGDPVPPLLLTDEPRSSLALAANMWFRERCGEKDDVVDAWRDFGAMSEYGDPSRLLFERAYLTKKIGIYDEGVLSDFETAYTLARSPHPSDVMRWGEHVWYTQGTEIGGRDIFRIAEKLALNVSQTMKLAAFYADAGDYRKAISLANKAKKTDSKAWEKYRFLGLSHFLYSEEITKASWARREHDMYNRLRANDGAFEAIVRSGSFAIVGSSPNQIGLGRGSRIDSHDYVVRFNQARPDASFAEDYGQKFNVWVKSAANLMVKRQPRREGIELALMHDSGLFLQKDMYYRLKDMDADYKLQLIPRTMMFEVIARIKRQPSLGLLVTYWASTLRNDLRNQKQIFGISLNDQAPNQTVHYYDPNYRGTGHRHDWDAERSLFDEIVLPEQAEQGA